MTVFHAYSEGIPAEAQGCVLVLGNFDGVHLGHRALVARAKEIAAEAGASVGVVTFEPHPRNFFQKDAPVFRLTPLPLKQKLLASLGACHVFTLAFDAALAGMAAEDFIEEILVRGLRARHVVIGSNFAFGKGRRGTPAMLQACPAFRTEVVEPVAAGGIVYSSTAARGHLAEGRFEEAAKILGWPWRIEAEVLHGDKRGRTLGFPTANQDAGEVLRIPYGIYAVRARVEGEGIWREGVASFGLRPMFRLESPLLETFIFDFSDEIYGKILAVQPVLHLRGEMKFDSLEALVAQMKEDCIAAKAVLKSLPDYLS